jgi:flagellar FliJ protein
VKRFTFRLERILKLKKQRQRLAELAQLQAAAVLEQAQKEEAALQEQLARNAAVLAAQVGRPVDTAAWLTHYSHAGQLGKSLDQAEANIQAAAKKLQEAAARLTQISTEVEVLLSLRRQYWEEFLQETGREEQKALDELVIERWRGSEKRSTAGERTP